MAIEAPKQIYKNKKTAVAVLMGGPSSEHEVSLSTGRNVVMNLDERKYEPVPVVISREEEWDIPPEKLVEEVDVAFVAMHGEFGEDGTVQGHLEALELPYTGSGPAESAFAMNKALSLKHLKSRGFTVPPTVHITKKEFRKNRHPILGRLHLLEHPWVLKPSSLGSSVDIYFIENEESLEKALETLLERHGEVIVQPKIHGREFTCGVLDMGLERSGYPLVPTEIIPNESHFFDYDSKYEKDGAEEITPARLSDIWLKHLQDIAKDVHHELYLHGMSRTDFIIGDDDEVYILEVNTIPGMTKTSLLPQGAREYGLDFTEMLDKIIEAAIRRYP